MARTGGSHPPNRGSIPLCAANKNISALRGDIFVSVVSRESNEGWVGGKATGFPPCRRLFRTEGSEGASCSIATSDVSFPYALQKFPRKSRIHDFVSMPLGIEDSRHNSCELRRNNKIGRHMVLSHGTPVQIRLAVPKKDIRIIIITGSFIVFTVLGVWLLWRNVPLLTAVLFVLALIELVTIKSKKLTIMFFLCCIGGGIVEGIAIYFGSWHYTEPTFLNIPLWLLPGWGN